MTRGGVAICWLAISVVCLIVYLRLERSAFGSPPHQRNDVDSVDESLDWTTKALLYVGGIIVVLVGITALLTPPSGIDAMSYHMPRVAMWINNHNVGFFPTADYTQLIYGAFAEYSIMHTILLWGNDRFANMIQFFSFVGCAIAVSYIVKLMGGGQRSQALAAFDINHDSRRDLRSSGANDHVCDFVLDRDRHCFGGMRTRMQAG